MPSSYLRHAVIVFFCLYASLLAGEEFSKVPMPWEKNSSSDPRCSLKPEKGPCKALFWKYAYDPNINQCKEFLYGGCDGVVPFDTKEECEKLCVESHDSPYPVKKPALYLYPLHKSDISVSLRINGTLTTTIPPYNDGWKVNARPNGMIDGKYDYLFYEADLTNIHHPKEGWSVSASQMKTWMDKTLPALGLNAKETRQFKEYWLAELPKAPFYAIYLLDDAFLSANMALDIRPKPDTLIRRNFYFVPLHQSRILKEPRIKAPKRKGFSVVEWGGIIGKDQ